VAEDRPRYSRPASRFDALASLAGKEGARSILRAEAGAVTIDFPQARFDVDTPADWRQLVRPSIAAGADDDQRAESVRSSATTAAACAPAPSRPIDASPAAKRASPALRREWGLPT
jgi:hypothetical protein